MTQKGKFDSDSFIGKVDDFHYTFNQVTSEKPCIPDVHTMKLRLSLIFEEFCELAEACGIDGVAHLQEITAKKASKINLSNDAIQGLRPNPVDALDALVDLQYVLSGAILAFGMQNVFDEAFEEVHDSNMSKACNSYEVAQDTINKRLSAFPEEKLHYTEDNQGKFFVYREDKKLIKANTYRPANLKQFIKDEF